MYTFESRVRYSETNESGRLSVTGIMNYLQDCSIFQSEELNIGIRSLKERKRAWWLNSWQILIDRYPRLGEPIRISTWPYSFKGIFGYRNFTICSLTGESMVRADSTWFFYDLEKNAPTRVPEEEILGYGIGEQPLPMPPAPRRIVLPDAYEEREPAVVTHYHLDTNHHVNNAQYVEIAREYVPAGFRVGEVRAEYRNAAVLGDLMYARVSRIQEGYVVSLKDKDEKIYANIWLAEKREDE